MADFPIFPPGLVKPDHRMQPMTVELQIYIKQVFWPSSNALVIEYPSYFKSFQKIISDLAWPNGIVYHQHFAMKTYGDLAKITECMRGNCGSNRSQIAEKLQPEFPGLNEKRILNSMDLAAYLWLNLNIRSTDHSLGPNLSNITNLEWVRDASLTDLIHDYLLSEGDATSKRLQPIDPSFTVENLRKFCRIEVRWTPNLKDHLSYDPTKSRLYLFPHKISLVSHLEFDDILPKDLLSETIKTLDLLFPFAEQGTRKYLDDEEQPFYQTSSRALSRAVDLSEFTHWRQRLDALHDVFHQAPRNVWQLWYDRRNPLQWWTFWLAALIAFLTIVFGIISSYTSFRQVALAEKAYELSVLQACSQGQFSASICGN